MGHVPYVPAHMRVDAVRPRAATPSRSSGGSGITPRAFTLETYIHLLSDELDAPLDLPAGGNVGGTSAPLVVAEDDRLAA